MLIALPSGVGKFADAAVISAAWHISRRVQPYCRESYDEFAKLVTPFSGQHRRRV